MHDLDKFVHKYNHLPGIPTANEVKINGIDLGEMNTTLLTKIEELALYLIDLQKQVDTLKKINH